MFTCLAPSKLKISEPWDKCVSIAAEAGFGGIEVPHDLAADGRAMSSRLQDAGLLAGGCTLHTPSLRADDSTFEAYVQQLPKLADLLKAVGSTWTSTWVAPASNELRYAENFKWHVARLSKVARVLADGGCTLAIEFVGPRSSREGLRFGFIHTIEQALELCEAVGPNAGLLLDSWHWHTSLGTLADLQMLDASMVAYVHVNDAPEGVPVQQVQDLSRALPASTGVIDIGAFMAELRRMKYAGPLVAEPFDSSLDGLDPQEAANRGARSMSIMLIADPHPVLPETMDTLAIGKKQVRIVQTPVPKPVGNQVVIKLHTSLLCGSNMGQFHGDIEKINGGHEGAGEVVAVAESSLLKVGDRVGLAPISACGKCWYCRKGDVILCQNRPPFDGNFAEYTRVADVMCIKLPDDISYDHGALLGCALGPAYGALRTLKVSAFDTVVVSGLGPVGIGVSALACYLNARVVGLDPEAGRRKAAESMGVAATFDPTSPDIESQLAEALGERGLLYGVECSGRTEAERLLIDQAAPNATLGFIGQNRGQVPFCPTVDLISKGLSLHGIWHMNMIDVDDLIVFLRRRPDLADMMITHRFGLADAQEAFDVFAARQSVKVALLPCAMG